MKAIEPQLTLQGAVLWRDGRRAVVSLKVGGVWLRILETDAEGMFHVEQSAAGLRRLWLEALDAAGLRANRLPNRANRTRRDHAATRKGALFEPREALP